MPPRPRAIRVRVKDHGQFTGSSTLQKPAANAAESIEGRILQARDTVYEEELFHELIREARVMAGRGITTRQDSIQLSGADEQEIVVDLVDAGPDSLSHEPEIHSHQHDLLADGISHTIHILLAFAHRQNLDRRTQMPPPLTQKRRHTPEYQLLRPVMAYLQHISHIRWLEAFLGDLYGVLKTAKLNCEHTSTPFSSLNLSRKNRPIPQAQALSEEFLRPLESTFTGPLSTPQNSLRVRVRTNLLPPFFGTHYDIEVNLPQYPQVRPPSRIGLRDEAAAVVTHFVLLDLVSAISTYRSPIPKGESPDEPRPEQSRSLTWEPSYPHHGELVASCPTTRRSQKMTVTLSREELRLQTYHAHGTEGHSRAAADQGPHIHSQTWRRDSPAEHSGLMEFVAVASRP